MSPDRRCRTSRHLIATGTMPNTIRAFFDTQIDLLLAGRLEELSRAYVLPVVVYRGGRPFVLQDADALVAVLGPLRQRFRGWGATGGYSETSCEARTGQDGLPVLVRYHYLDRAGTEVGSSRLRYYLIDGPDGRPKIAMVEYLQMPAPVGAAVGPRGDGSV